MTSAPLPDDPTAPLPRLRMLYVEDDRLNALLFEEALALRGGIELRIAEDAEQALAVARDWPPQILVLDAHLPGGTGGHELLAALRRLPGLWEVPAYMCSADARPDDLQRAREAGFAGYWAKPIDIARMFADLDALRQRMPR